MVNIKGMIRVRIKFVIRVKGVIEVKGCDQVQCSKSNDEIKCMDRSPTAPMSQGDHINVLKVIRGHY